MKIDSTKFDFHPISWSWPFLWMLEKRSLGALFSTRRMEKYTQLRNTPKGKHVTPRFARLPQRFAPPPPPPPSPGRTERRERSGVRDQAEMNWIEIGVRRKTKAARQGMRWKVFWHENLDCVPLTVVIHPSFAARAVALRSRRMFFLLGFMFSLLLIIFLFLQVSYSKIFLAPGDQFS